MSTHDYSGIDVADGRRWGRAGWSLFSAGRIVVSIGFAAIFVHVLVVLMYARSLPD